EDTARRVSQDEHERDSHRHFAQGRDLDRRQPWDNVAEEAACLEPGDEQVSSRDRADDARVAAGGGGEEDVDGDKGLKQIGRDIGYVRSVERACERGYRTADHEGLSLEAHDRLAGYR